MPIRRTSTSSSGETAISVVASMPCAWHRKAARLRKICPIGRRLVECWLIGRRPERAGRHIEEIAERAPVVACTILAPACDCDVLPATVAAARVRYHHVISTVRQQLYGWYRRGGTAENSKKISTHSHPPPKPARRKPATTHEHSRINCHSKPVRWFSIIRNTGPSFSP